MLAFLFDKTRRVDHLLIVLISRVGALAGGRNREASYLNFHQRIGGVRRVIRIRMNSDRQLAHDLIDRLPETQLSGLVRYLKEIVDPVSSALNSAPTDDEPESNDERRAVEESRRWLDGNRDRGVPYDEAMRQLGLD